MKRTIYLFLLTLISLLLILPKDVCAQLDTNDFVTTWKTDNVGTLSDSSSIYISTNPNYSYNYDVDWNNDGIFDSFGLTNSVLHHYPQPGTYTIRIRGQFPAINFGGTLPFSKWTPKDERKLVSIEQWGNQAWKTLEHGFHGCFYLDYNATDVPNLDSLTSLAYLFSYIRHFNSDIEKWDVSNVTNLEGMLYHTYYFNGDLNSWDVSNVTNMSNMFAYTGMFNTSINNWDVSSVLRFDKMFFHAFEFNQNINSWDLSSAQNMEEMFSFSSKFNQSLSNWDVSSVTNMNSMFKNAQLFNQDISNWDVSRIDTLKEVFKNARSFNQNLGAWDIDSVKNMSGLFDNTYISKQKYDSLLMQWSAKNQQNNLSIGVEGLQYCLSKSFRDTLKQHGWNFIGDLQNCDTTHFVTSWRRNCASCASTTINLNADPNYSYNYDVDIDNDEVFDFFGITGNFTHTYPDTGKIKTIRIRGNFPSIKFYNNNIHRVDQWGIQNWKSLNDGFLNTLLVSAGWDRPNLDSLNDLSFLFFGTRMDSPIDHWDVSSINQMKFMFSNTAFNHPLNSWDVSNVFTMRGMFFENFYFNSDISAWDVSNVLDMRQMFHASVFNQAISNWDVSNVLFMYGMFSISEFNQDISNWDVSNVHDMSSMFDSSPFNQNINSWNVSNVTDMGGMFYDAVYFNQNLGDWSITNVTNMDYMFNNTPLSVKNYDSTLIGWQSKTHRNNVLLGANQLHFCAGDSARTALINDGWIITGDALDPNCVITNLEESFQANAESLIYPNPTSGIVFINVPEASKTELLEVYSSTGKLLGKHLLYSSNMQINLEKYGNGLYFLKWNNNTQKVIVQR